MRVAVTGGLGYIGCWLTRMLKFYETDDVVVIDSGLYPSGVSAFVSGWVGDVEWIEKDIRKVTAYDLEGVDAVCHLAGLSNDPTADFDPELNKQLNVVATKSIGIAAKEAGVKHFTFASSASVYGFNMSGSLSETDPVDPKSGYASSKYEAENVLLDIDGLDPVIFRQATVGGWSPRMRWDLVVNTMTMCGIENGVIKVHAGGEAYRPLIDVQDVANAHCIAVRGEISPGIYNLCHRRKASESGMYGYTIACLALWIASLLGDNGYDVKVEGDWGRTEGRSYDISSDKLLKECGWEPSRTVKDSVEDIVDRYQAGLTKTMDSKNIDWMKCLDHAQHLQDTQGYVL